MPKAVPAMSESAPPLIAATDSRGTRMDMSELLRWKPTAHQLVRNGTTSKDPEIVAAILAEHAAGAPPSTISRRRGVHHSTVGRILAGAAALAGYKLPPASSESPVRSAVSSTGKPSMIGLDDRGVINRRRVKWTRHPNVGIRGENYRGTNQIRGPTHPADRASVEQVWRVEDLAVGPGHTTNQRFIAPSPG